ncbi:MAG: histone deacetylase [Acidobacteriota bacterium]|nr:histone deacetylase [Acidobacteriota bacterium]
MKIVYSDQYDLNLGDHVFRAAKYRLTKEKLLRDGVVVEADVLEPEAAPDEDIARVHDADYIEKLKQGTLSYQEILMMEVPYSQQLVQAVWLAAGGSTMAARLALDEGAAVNVGGGFHHAFPDHGEGFCVIHDVAVAIRRLQAENAIKTAMTIDCDVHQGNGTAFIFRDDPSVFTFSIHQKNNYPNPKPPSNLDVNLRDGVEDDEYLAELERGIGESLAGFQPDLIFYIAGADPYFRDQLGGLRLTMDGLKQRDRMVFEKAGKIPVAVTLAGGYAFHLEDTVEIHSNTARITSEFAR